MVTIYNLLQVVGFEDIEKLEKKLKGKKEWNNNIGDLIGGDRVKKNAEKKAREAKGKLPASKEDKEKFKKDFQSWKFEQKIDQNAKVFFTTDAYKFLKMDLLSRGWA